MIKNCRYFPILKTSYAELKGYENLSDKEKDSIIPIFELTRSRITKNNSEGTLSLRMQDLFEKVGDRPFILDLTTEEALSNKEIDSPLTPGHFVKSGIFNPLS